MDVNADATPATFDEDTQPLPSSPEPRLKETAVESKDPLAFHGEYLSAAADLHHPPAVASPSTTTLHPDLAQSALHASPSSSQQGIVAPLLARSNPKRLPSPPVALDLSDDELDLLRSQAMPGFATPVAMVHPVLQRSSASPFPSTQGLPADNLSDREESQAPLEVARSVQPRPGTEAPSQSLPHESPESQGPPPEAVARDDASRDGHDGVTSSEVWIDIPSRHTDKQVRTPPSPVRILPRPAQNMPPPQASSSRGPAETTPEDAAAIAAALEAHAVGRSLRRRRPEQLNPYTIEQAIYRHRLVRNQWEDAVVSQTEVARETKRAREEARRLAEESQGVSEFIVEDEETKRKKAEEKAQRKAKAAERRAEKRRAREAEEARLAAMERTAEERKADAKRLFELYGGELSSTSSEEDERGPVAVAQPQPHRRVPTATYARRRSEARGRSRSDSPASAAQGEVSAAESSSSGPLPPATMKRRRLDVARSSSESRHGSPITSRHGSPIADMPDMGGDDDIIMMPRSDGSDLDVAQHVAPAQSSATESEQDLPDPRQLSEPRKRRLRRREGTHTGSDSDSTDYERYFRQLKRMMPVHMARKHIADLRNMRRGKAYHSDGHVSSTPEPSSDDDATPARPRRRSTPATSPQQPDEVRPGEAREKPAARDGAVDDARFALVGDPLSDSEDDAGAISVSSDSEDGARAVDGDIRWWAVPQTSDRPFQSSRGLSKADDIDRMLMRAEPRKSAKTKRTSRTMAYRGPRSSPTPADRFHSTSATTKRKKKKHGHTSASRPTTSKTRYPAPQGRPHNPPVVAPRLRPRLRLLDDNVLFDFEMPVEIPSVVETGRTVPAHSSNSTHAVSSPAARASGGSVPGGVGTTPQPPRRSVLAPLSANRAGIPPFGIRTPASKPATTSNQGVSRSAIQPRIESAFGTSAARALTPHQQEQLAEANAWEDFEHVSLDFSIRPLPTDVCFARTSYIGRGRLFELLGLGQSEVGEPVAGRPCFAMGLDLEPEQTTSELLESLPKAFDAVYAAIHSGASKHGTEDPERQASQLDDVLRFLAIELTRRHRDQELYRSIVSQLDHLHQRCHSAELHYGKVPSATRDLLTLLLWFRVEISWRRMATTSTTYATWTPEADDMAADFEQNVRTLLLALLIHGMNRTMKKVKLAAAGSEGEDGARPGITDISAQIWVCLIHLLEAAETAPWLGPSSAGFWPTFEHCYARWLEAVPQRSSTLNSETTWYTILGICALAQFAPALGTVTHRRQLPTAWGFVQQTLAKVRLRYDEDVERAMSGTALAQRDGYVRLLLQRCANLASLWHWSMHDAEGALSRLFQLFESHRLANLPTERDHDFAPFLRSFDERMLFDDARREESAFHLFLKLLARAAADMRTEAGPDATQADRSISRLQSRMMPVRVMPFTDERSPTPNERSMLFNHYSLAMLSLHLVPALASQRLRQIRSFLNFKTADAHSQVTCVRAMMYTAVLYRHHGLDVAPLVAWFAAVIKALCQSYAEGAVLLPASARFAPPNPERNRALRQQRRIASLVVAALRSMQHVVEIERLTVAGSEKVQPPGFPDVGLLTGWLVELLDDPIVRDSAIGSEALKCLQVFLVQRKAALQAVAAPVQAIAPAADSESQDSFADVFDDIQVDFADPALDALLGGGGVEAGGGAASNVTATSDQRSALRAKDRDFAGFVLRSISPALFRLLSHVLHPDEAMAGNGIVFALTGSALNSASSMATGMARLDGVMRQASRRVFGELLIDCWAGCAEVLVRHEMREWSSYLEHGVESLRLLTDPTRRREAALRFLLNVATLDEAGFVAHADEALVTWFGGVAAKDLSVQHVFTAKLLSLCGDLHPWLRDAPWPREPGSGKPCKLDMDQYRRARPQLLTHVLSRMGSTQKPSAGTTHGSLRVPSGQATFACISGLLWCLRSCSEADVGSTTERLEYLTYCRTTLEDMRRHLGPNLMRGAEADIKRTEAHVERIQSQLEPPGAKAKTDAAFPREPNEAGIVST